MAVSHEQYKTATARSKKPKAVYAAAVSAKYDRRVSRVVIRLDTGLELSFSPGDSNDLSGARPSDLETIELSPSGLGIYFPKLDVDLYIPSLLEGFLGSKTWHAAESGRKGGRSTSTAKREAARLNGRRGGRPKANAAGGTSTERTSGKGV